MGFAMVLIGLGLSLISRSARLRERPTAGVPLAVVSLEPNPATVSAPVPDLRNLASPVVTSNGQAVLLSSKSLAPDSQAAHR